MRILLDSNAYSLLMRGHEQLAELVRRAEEILLSAIVCPEELLSNWDILGHALLVFSGGLQFCGTITGIE